MNQDSENYLEKYCAKHKITKDEAKEHLLVKGVLEIYEKKEHEEADV